MPTDAAAPIPLDYPRDQNVTDAMAHDTPVIIYCLACNRSRKADPALIAQKLGPLPFGLSVGKFPCKRCDARVAVVLPWYAPTPREWAKIAADHLRQPEEPQVHVDGRRFGFRIDIWRANHTIVDRTAAYLDSPTVAHIAFESYLAVHPRDDITLSNGALLLRDSRRPDVKKVKG